MYPIWLLAHVFQSESLRNYFLSSTKRFSQKASKEPGFRSIKILENNPSKSEFDKLLKEKVPILLRGLTKKSSNLKEIDHSFLLENLGDFKTNPRFPDNQENVSMSISQILANSGDQPGKFTIASKELAENKVIQKKLDLTSLLPSKKVLSAPLKNQTLFVSTKGFYTGLHMEAGRLLNIQLSGKKQWFLISPEFTHYLEPLLTDTTIHFSEIVRKVEDIETRLSQKIPIYRCTMEPGDVLLIPPFFWHTVSCEEDAVSLTHQWLTLFGSFFESPFLSLFLLTSRKPSIFQVIFGKSQKDQYK